MKKLLILGAAAAVVTAAPQAMAQQNYPAKSGDTTLGQARYQTEMHAEAVPPSEEILRTEPAAGASYEDKKMPDFTGPYFGGSVAFSTGDAEVSTPLAAGDVGLDGMTGGAFAGYGFEFPKFISGLAPYGSFELGYEWSDIDGSVNGVSFEKNNGWMATVRPGIAVKDDLLAYGIVGYSRAEFESETSDDEFNGLMLGAGAEFNTPLPLRMRIEYAYTNYEDDSLGGADFDAHDSAIKAGAVLRF